jgi:hypothetical protein
MALVGARPTMTVLVRRLALAIGSARSGFAGGGSLRCALLEGSHGGGFGAPSRRRAGIAVAAALSSLALMMAARAPDFQERGLGCCWGFLCLCCFGFCCVGRG